MKILDKYILKTFLVPFLATFLIVLFVLVMQLLWQTFESIAVLKFLWYVSPRLIPLVLPLTILVTSLMVFGSFSENYEFAAMKSTGISLQRAMRSLTIVAIELIYTDLKILI